MARAHISSQSGFTLLELVVTIAIAGILTSIALPSMLSLTSQREADSVGQDFEQDVAWARSEAVAGVPQVSVTLNPDCSWSTVENGSSTPVASHSKTTTQVQAQSPGLTCSGIPTGGILLSFSNLGLVSATSSPVIGFGSGSGALQMQIFSSGVIVGDPGHAS